MLRRRRHWFLIVSSLAVELLLLLTCLMAVTVFFAALLAYRTWPFSKPVNKLVHVLWHMVAVTVFSIGLSAVWR